MKNKWLLLLLAGLLLLVIALPVSEPENRKTKEAETDTVNEEDYASMAEAKLEKILAQRRAGKVKVMITLSSSSEKIVEKDKETSKDETQSTSSETTVYEETTDRGQTPYVAKELTPAVEGW